MKTIRETGTLRPHGLRTFLEFKRVSNFPVLKEDTPVQIEISPADAPTREELIEALREARMAMASSVAHHREVDALLSRCKEADHA